MAIAVKMDSTAPSSASSPDGASFPFSVLSLPYSGTWTNRNAALTTGGTSQQLMPVNVLRKFFFIQNPATAVGQNIPAAENLYINYTSAAGVADGASVELLPGGTVPVGPVATTEAINFNAATSGHKVIAREM